MALKGIKGGYTADEIKDEIKNLSKGNLCIAKVILAKFSTENNPIYIVQIDANSTLKDLTEIKIIAHQRARWEQLKKHKLFQCMRCQRLGHASLNCRLPPRCVKCSLNHIAGSCTITSTDEKNKLKCANCNAFGHPASYRGCPFYKQAIDIYAKNITYRKRQENNNNYTQYEKRVKPITSNPLTFARHTVPHISYANAVNSNNSQFNIKTANYIPYSTFEQHQTAEGNSNNAQLPPPWLEDLKREMTQTFAQMVNELRQQMNNRIDGLISELGITEL